MQSNWIAANWWQVLLALTMITGHIVVLANNVLTVRELKTEFIKLREGHITHINEPGLHRGPDFELRMMNMERQLETQSRVLGVIDSNVATLLKK